MSRLTEYAAQASPPPLAQGRALGSQWRAGVAALRGLGLAALRIRVRALVRARVGARRLGGSEHRVRQNTLDHYGGMTGPREQDLALRAAAIAEARGGDFLGDRFSLHAQSEGTG